MTDSAAKTGRIGRPPSKTAGSHAAIMDAVYALLQETSVRDLTMEAVAKRAGVGKPTLYKWWPTKAALVFAMFHERLAGEPTVTKARTAEAAALMYLSSGGKPRAIGLKSETLLGCLPR